MQKITPFLWLDGGVEEAMGFYVGVFKASRVVNVVRHGEAGPGAPGSVFYATIELDGMELALLDGGPAHAFTEAISFFVSCEDQDEVDDLWGKLTDGGEESRCGWLKDRFGLSWQIIPQALGELMGDPDPVKAGRVRDALLRMDKIDVAALRRAYEGSEPMS
jgi:predicted 3-demethylubiquinone-9 3-methyltransferase (glyoxalase superfamily)